MTRLTTSSSQLPTLESLGIRRHAGITSQTLKASIKLTMHNFQRSSEGKKHGVSLSTLSAVLRAICEYGRKGAMMKDGSIKITAHPSIQTIARDIYRNEKTVRRSIRQLRDAVGLRVEKRLLPKDASGRLRTKLHYSITLPTTPEIDNGEILATVNGINRVEDRVRRETSALRMVLDQRIEAQRMPTLAEALSKSKHGFVDPAWLVQLAQRAIDEHVSNHRDRGMEELIETNARACIEIVSYIVRENINPGRRAGFFTNQLKFCATGCRAYLDVMRSDDPKEVDRRIADLRKIASTVSLRKRKMSIEQCQEAFRSYENAHAAIDVEAISA